MPESIANKTCSPEEFKLRIQVETMLLTWVRTAISFIGFGFVTARFGIFLRQIATVGDVHVRAHPHIAFLNTLAGTLMIGLGVVILIVGILGHRRTIDRLDRGELDVAGKWSMGVIISIALAVIGTAMAIYLSVVVD
jgi:putative membrane protein